MRTPILKHKLAFTLLLSLGVICGCAHEYLMELNNGGRVISRSKPIPRGTNYFFTDISGEEHLIPQGRVVKIKPVSVVNEVEKPSPAPKPKTPRRWYFLWLA